MGSHRTIAQRTVASILWNAAANSVVLVVAFGRSIALARLLPVEIFGVYAFAGAIVGLSGMLPQFGLSWAFLHRSAETQHEGTAAANYFTLQLLFSSIWAGVVALGAGVLADEPLRTALWVLCGTSVVSQLNMVAHVILVRRVVHRRLALLQVGDVLLTTLVALVLAYRGVTLWALLATNIATSLLHTVALYLWRPVWRPRLQWDIPVIRYFLRFGSRQFLSEALRRALDQIDDVWTGIFLGPVSTGFYSRAYAFATYPRKIVALPVNTVFEGTYAELKEQPEQLSRAFFSANALLIRTGFLLGGLLFLIAPEFIRLALTDRWLPMLTAFRLMLMYTLFDPLKGTIAGVLLALGKPELVLKTRSVQFIIMISGLMVLGPLFDIAGVALAVNLMLVVGIGLLLRQVRAYVDYSLRALFAVPLLGLGLGLLLAYLAFSFPGVAVSDWHAGIIKAVVFTTVYGLILTLLERQNFSLLGAALRKRWL